jgi:pyridoxamine 5'-phosphate oxidase
MEKNTSKDLFDFSKGPLENFKELFQYAEASGVPEPSAMSLATVDNRGFPEVRVVLFKGLHENGLTFYTNYNSQKGNEIEKNNNVSVVFFWPQLATQIRVSGEVQKLDREQSEAYFKIRPRVSQLGAWASLQSQTISSYKDLENRFNLVASEYEGKQVPCPPYWGGYLIIPKYFEFWFGIAGRLHHRYIYASDPFSISPGDSTVWIRSMKSP